MIEMVFFDVGETLLRPHPSFPELFARTAAERGVTIDAAEAAEVQQRLAPHLVELAEESGVDKPSLSADGSKVFWSYLYRRLLAEFDVHDESLVDHMYSVFSSAASYKLFDDVLPALEAIEGDYRLGVISNFENWLEDMLVELEVGHRFEVTLISGIEGIEKPDPIIYERALERAGTAPEHTVHVGDSPEMDVRPAREVGMRPILLDRYDRYPDIGCPTIRSLRELPELLEQLDRTGPGTSTPPL